MSEGILYLISQFPLYFVPCFTCKFYYRNADVILEAKKKKKPCAKDMHSHSSLQCQNAIIFEVSFSY